MSSVHETAYPRLKADVSEQELAEIYTPSAMERSFARKHGDTQEQSAPVFGLAYLLGINLMPRIRHLKQLVIRGEIPKVPATLEGQGFFEQGELRYWSMCQNELYSQAVKECMFDEQVTINPDSFYTIVSSLPENRPENANAAFLIMRFMLPATDFEQTVQNTSVAGDEASVMGEYQPKATYMNRPEFEALGCEPYASLPFGQL